MSPDNGWAEYQRLVLAELKRLDLSVQSTRKELAELRVAVEVLRSRAVTWGALGGFLVYLTSLFGTRLFNQ
jgi:hypothetical protein